MWEKVQADLPDDVASVTTSVWQYGDIMQIGLMRHSMLQPPVLWATVLNAGFRNVRKAPGLLDELQRMLYAPVVLAETDPAEGRNGDLLLYLGFQQLPDKDGRHQYMRSI